MYFNWASGELDKANQVYEEWSQTYPRDSIPPLNLGANYATMGQHEKSVQRVVDSLHLNPDSGASYGILIHVYRALGRLDQAKVTYEQAIARKLEDPDIHASRYLVAFLEGDSAEMRRQMEWAKDADPDIPY